MSVTVVLPCSGAGTRLGLPFPKELAPLSPGRVVIDSCLDLIKDTDSRIVLMDDGKREQTRRHIERRLPGTPMAVVKNPGFEALPNAVMSLQPWLTDTAVLMLPDEIGEKPAQEHHGADQDAAVVLGSRA